MLNAAATIFCSIFEPPADLLEGDAGLGGGSKPGWGKASWEPLVEDCGGQTGMGDLGAKKRGWRRAKTRGGAGGENHSRNRKPAF